MSTSRFAAEEIQRSLDIQARKLGREMKVPGFRTGKIPPAVVIQRIGREPILDEAVRGRLTDWYMKAVDESGIAPVGDPDVDLDLAKLPPEGKPLTFSFEVGVRPTATLGTYRGLEVVRREPSADAEAVDAQIEDMRERFSRLEPVDRPAANGDHVILDFVGTIDGEPFEGGEGRDQLVEVGAGRLIPGFEEGLVGVSAGEEKTVDATFPDDYAAKHVAGKPAQFQFTVKEVKNKDLPDARRRLRLRRRRLRHARGAARVDRQGAARARHRRASRRSSAQARWTPSSPRRRSTCPIRSSPRAPRSCWIACSTRSATRGSPRSTTSRSPARPKRI